MEHSFDIEIAQEYGIQCAIILKNIYFWIEKNRANDKHFHDGKYWTYNSIKAMTELFPYMSKNTINRALDKLEEEGLVITGNFNGVAYDRTKWYALTDLGYSICEKTELDLPKIRNGITQSQKPIPDINTYNKPNINIYIGENEDPASPDGNVSCKDLHGHDYQVAVKNGFSHDIELLSAYADFFKMRKSIKKPLSDRAVSMLKNQLEKLAPNDVKKQIAILNQSTFHCWQGVFELKTDRDDSRQDAPKASGGWQ